MKSRVYSFPKLDDQLVTRGMLKGILSRSFKKRRLEWKSELQREIHGLEYRLNLNMEAMIDRKLEEKIDTKIVPLLDLKLNEQFDSKLTPLIKEMREYRETFQQLADKIIGEDKNFETESASIRQNYTSLRVG